MECDRHQEEDCEDCWEREAKEREALYCRCSILAHCRCGRRDWVVHQYGSSRN